MSRPGGLRRAQSRDAVRRASFDDAFADVRDNALPVLEARGFRATVFVTTGVTGGRHTFPWYDRQPPVLC